MDANSLEKGNPYVLFYNDILLVFEDVIQSYGKITDYQGRTINYAIKDYYSFSTNKEKVSVLKWIVSQPQFLEMKRFTEDEYKIYALNEGEYDEILKSGEMPNNLQIAQKFIKNKFDVFLLSNPSNTKSADFILHQKEKLFYVEGKTSSGGGALATRLNDGAKQSDRIAINLQRQMNTKDVFKEIVDAFHKNENIKVLYLFKKTRLIQLDRFIVESKDFECKFFKIWNQRK